MSEQLKKIRLPLADGSVREIDVADEAALREENKRLKEEVAQLKKFTDGELSRINFIQTWNSVAHPYGKYDPLIDKFRVDRYIYTWEQAADMLELCKNFEDNAETYPYEVTLPTTVERLPYQISNKIVKILGLHVTGEYTGNIGSNNYSVTEVDLILSGYPSHSGVYHYGMLSGLNALRKAKIYTETTEPIWSVFSRTGSSLKSFELIAPYAESVNDLFDTTQTLCVERAIIDTPNLKTTCRLYAGLGCLNDICFEFPNLEWSRGLFKYCGQLTRARIVAPKLTVAEEMFYCCEALQSVNLECGEITDAESMFESCYALPGLNNWSYPALENAERMFAYCYALTLPDKVSFPEVTTGANMFRCCTSVQTFDMLDMPKLQKGSDMFYGCMMNSINMTFPELTSAFEMFKNCTNLETVVFNAPKLTSSYGMFDGCSALTSVDLSNLDTLKMTSMSSMFYNCASLENINLSNFDTSKVTSMSYMFYNCASLKTLNLSGWDFSAVTSTSAFATRCAVLTDIIGPVSGISANLSFSDSPLTNESAMVIINGLAEVTAKRTLQLSAATYDSLSDQQIALATSKGWTVTRR